MSFFDFKKTFLKFKKTQTIQERTDILFRLSADLTIVAIRGYSTIDSVIVLWTIGEEEWEQAEQEKGEGEGKRCCYEALA